MVCLLTWEWGINQGVHCQQINYANLIHIIAIFVNFQMNSMSVKVLLMIWSTLSCIKCTLVSVCSDVPIPLNATPVHIGFDCSTLQCEGMMFNIDFADNNWRCSSWTANGVPHNSQLLIKNSKTQSSVIVNLTAVCLDQRTPMYLQCHMYMYSYGPSYNIHIKIYNSMCLLTFIHYWICLFIMLEMLCLTLYMW